MSAYTIGFLKHSGFYLELDDCILVFDYYQDPEGILDSLLADTVKDLYPTGIMITLIRKLQNSRIRQSPIFCTGIVSFL